MSALERLSRIEAFSITTLSCPYFASLRRMFWQSMRSVGEVSEIFQPKKNIECSLEKGIYIYIYI